MIVDTHIHVLSDDLEKYPAAPIGGQFSPWSQGRHNTDEEFVAQMKEAGVDQATLVQASTFHGYDNNYTADCAARHPDKFVGVCCIDPLQPDAIATLTYWIKERGMRGLRLFTSGSSVPEGNWLDDPLTFPTWEASADLGIAVDAQIRITGLDKLRNILERFPTVNVILDHLAFPRVDDGPPYAQMKELLELSRYANLYLKCSENNIRSAEGGTSTSRDFFSTLIRDFGANRIMWGSNFPASAHDPPVSYKEIVDHAREALAFLPANERGMILGENARNLYPDLKGQRARVS